MMQANHVLSALMGLCCAISLRGGDTPSNTRVVSGIAPAHITGYMLRLACAVGCGVGTEKVRVTIGQKDISSSQSTLQELGAPQDNSLRVDVYL